MTEDSSQTVSELDKLLKDMQKYYKNATNIMKTPPLYEICSKLEEFFTRWQEIERKR